MNNYINNLINELNKLPGIGIKTAQKLSQHILNLSEPEIESLVNSILSVKRNIKKCKVCGNYTTEDLCDICSDEKRDFSKICIVQDILDLNSIEKTQIYNGLYHVLFGVISPLDGIGPNSLNLNTLFERIQSDNISEIFIALNPTVEGEGTSQYIVNKIKEINPNINITKIAYGLNFGSNINYIDDLTLTEAIKNRKKV